MRCLVATLLSACLLAVYGAPAAGADPLWTQIGTGITQGISGAAAGTSGGWVVVRDNKTAGQNRVALLSADNVITTLSWPGSAPQDLEAIDAVPGQSGRYAVVTSAGAGRIISVTGTTMSVVRSFSLPTGRNQNEGFALTRFGSTTVAVWGNRGASATPGRLFAAKFNAGTGVFGAVAQGPVSVPYPTTNVRHISDTKVLAGRIVVSSASDPGDNGPFDSALYDVGTVALVSGRARLTLATPVSLGMYPGHKVEAIACNGTTGILGTDDENLGGWVTPATFCG
jgi:hypothetical protein